MILKAQKWGKEFILGQKIFAANARKYYRPFDIIPRMHSLQLP